MDKDFLLTTETAKKLYHEHAEGKPIIDYHCHLQPKEIYEDKKFRNLAEVWLGAGDRYGDHYKWRALRARGYEEDSISGNVPGKTLEESDYQKYYQFVESMPYFVGNPLYHWSHLEMQRYFDIYDVINTKNAKKIWDAANKKLETLTAREMMYKFNVKVVCTTDDPVDDLHYHKLMKEDKTLKVDVRPAFRPDKAINVELDWFGAWVEQLSKVVGYKLDSVDALTKALAERIEFFHSMGSRLSDHALDVVHYAPATKEEVNAIYLKGLKNEPITAEEEDKYKGLKIGFVSMIPYFVLFAVCLIFAFGANKDMTVSILTLPMFYVFQILRAIIGNVTVLGDLSVWQFLLIFATLFIVPICAEVSYLLGYKDILIFEKLTYKKKK